MSPVTVVRRGSWSQIEGDQEDIRRVYAVLHDRFAYRMEGAQYSEAFRSKRWDGRVSLLRHIGPTQYALPSGLCDEALALLRRHDVAFDVRDLRQPGKPLPDSVLYQGHPPRPYQLEAADVAVRQRLGVLQMCIRSGKTLTASMIIAALGRRALFVVPSQLLLTQTANALREALDVTVGECGEGAWEADDADVVVATIQTLVARSTTKPFARLAASVGTLVIDEAHHLLGYGEAWRDTVMAVQAANRIGLSATVDEEGTGGFGKDIGSIWMRGVCGPVLYTVTLSDLIDQGYLCQPYIWFVDYGEPAVTTRWDHSWDADKYDRLITKCERRNEAVASIAAARARQGAGVLVDVGRIAHGRLLHESISRRLPPGRVALLMGANKGRQRQQALEAFRDGRVRVLVSNLLGEGVDIPQITDVINAEAGKAWVSTEQRMRNLTPAPGKTTVHVWEMVDVHHPNLLRWTRRRMLVYGKEPAFRMVAKNLRDVLDTLAGGPLSSEVLAAL